MLTWRQICVTKYRMEFRKKSNNDRAQWIRRVYCLTFGLSVACLSLCLISCLPASRLSALLPSRLPAFLLCCLLTCLPALHTL